MKLSHVTSETVTFAPNGLLGLSWAARSDGTMPGVPRRSEKRFHQVRRSSLLKPSLPSSVNASMPFWRSQMLNCHQTPVESEDPKYLPPEARPAFASHSLYSAHVHSVLGSSTPISLSFAG